MVIIGHSQGGGAAWVATRKQAVEPIEGLLGTVAISPVTRVLAEPGPFLPILGAAICPAIAALYPIIDFKALLTEEGANRHELVMRTGGCSGTGLSLLLGADLFKPGWFEDPHIQKYQSLAFNGEKPVGSPLLVIRGASDPQISNSVTDTVVTKTMEVYPTAQIEYITLADITHVPALTAS